MTSPAKHQRGVPDGAAMLSGVYYVVSDEKLPSSQCRATKKKNSNNDDVSLQSTNKENVWEAEEQHISDTPVSNLHLAQAHTKQKETTETKEAREVPNLASTLVGESTKAQVEELLQKML
jgi:peptide methionine sulfoxide reductase MsrA